MPTASNLTPESRFMALFVGPKHSGKTVAACSWMSEDKKKRVKVLDNDGRIKGILACPWIDASRVDYDYYEPRATSGKIFFERVNQDLEAFKVELDNRKSPYETYICDSATSFCRNLIIDALPLTHAQGGKKLGVVNMAGPEDYGFESTATDSYIAWLRSLPTNVIVTAHVVDKYDKPMITDAKGRSYKDTYADSIIVGEKLSIRDKIAANISIYFDHIFRFDRRLVRGEERFFVRYISDIACTSFPNLTPAEYDITGKNFREFTLNLIRTNNGNVSK